MVCCFFFSGEPGAVDGRGRYKTWDGPNTFQTNMLKAPCHSFPMSCVWCMGCVTFFKRCQKFVPFEAVELIELIPRFCRCCSYDFFNTHPPPQPSQFLPCFCTCTQYALRVKALEGDMTRYSCFRKSTHTLRCKLFASYPCTLLYPLFVFMFMHPFVPVPVLL